ACTYSQRGRVTLNSRSIAREIDNGSAGLKKKLPRSLPKVQDQRPRPEPLDAGPALRGLSTATGILHPPPAADWLRALHQRATPCSPAPGPEPRASASRPGRGARPPAPKLPCY